MVTPLPFSIWRIDVIRPINLKAFNRLRFILMAINYFTKWIKVTSYTHVTQNVVNKFIRKDIIYRYGIQKTIKIDNAQN